MYRLVALLATTLITVTACSSETSGGATPSPTSEPSAIQTTQSSAPEGASPTHGAPKVTNPLNIDHFLQKPCDTLTTDQIVQIFGEPTSSSEDGSTSGPGCSWSRLPTYVGVLYPTMGNQGLSAFYAARATTYPLFLELGPIDGYPSIAYDKVDERMTRGECAVAVGTSDDHTMAIDLTLSAKNVGKKDPCAVGHDIATMAIHNIEGRQ